MIVIAIARVGMRRERRAREEGTEEERKRKKEESGRGREGDRLRPTENN